MAELSVRELNKYYGENHVLKGITFEVYKGERVGLLGKNGSGKTTLFKVISGLENYESGFVDICSGKRVGILDQIPQYPEDYSVLDVLNTSFEEPLKLQAEMIELEKQMESDTDPAILKHYGAVQSKFDALGGYMMESRITRVCSGLSISSSMQMQTFSCLSGGEKTRVNLARIMLQEADILLLDEPTNHLDIASVEWLEDYLLQYSGTVVVISHDRYFLDRVVGRIIELEDGKAGFYEGNYSYYAKEKEERFLQQTAAFEGQQKEIKRLQDAADKLHEWARNADSKALHVRAFAIEKRIEHMDKVERPSKEKKLTSSFQENRFSGKDVITLKDTCKSYGGNQVLRDINLSVHKGDRIALIGANGCGKTTLVRILTGEEAPDSGSASIGQSIDFCYLPQLVTFENPQFTVLETVRYALETNEEKARQKLAAFHFNGRDTMKKVEALSGGEKSRLRLCISMQESINLLVLDEPTNHLDIASLEWIEAAVSDFSGTLLFVSHDRYFIRRFATRIWELEHGHITDFDGTYEEYRSRKLQSANANLPKTAAVPKPHIKPEVQSVHKVREQPKPKTLDELETEINQLECRIEEINRDMENAPSDYLLLDSLLEEKRNLTERIDILYRELVD